MTLVIGYYSTQIQKYVQETLKSFHLDLYLPSLTGLPF